MTSQTGTYRFVDCGCYFLHSIIINDTVLSSSLINNTWCSEYTLNPKP